LLELACLNTKTPRERKLKKSMNERKYRREKVWKGKEREMAKIEQKAEDF